MNNNVTIIPATAIDMELTYKAKVKLATGSIVKIPLGSRVVTGVVSSNQQGFVEEAKLKEIKEQINLPSYSAKMLEFLKRVAKYNLAPIGAVVKMSLCSDKAYEEEVEQVYVLANSLPQKPTKAQLKVIEFLKNNNEQTAAEIKSQAGVSAAVLKTMQNNNLLICKERIKKSQQENKIPKQSKLSVKQQEAADKMAVDHYKAFLLDGITGSGKTEVFLNAIKQVIENDGQALILLPEIVLTDQVLKRVKEYFGIDIIAWHSNLTPKQRALAWRKVIKNEAQIVVGARSAMFLPFANLKMIVVDEEHDSSYKQEEGVVYQARDMAVLKAYIEDVPIILSSATPSIESFNNYLLGKYERVHLPERHGAATLPDVEIVDMKLEKLPAAKFISTKLQQKIEQTINANKQVLLFLNRRGYAPLTLCRKCGFRFQCPSCAAWMVEHKSAKSLECHHCGHNINLPKACPECKSEEHLVACGPGVERIIEEVKTLFPQQEVEEITSDNITSFADISAKMERIKKGEVKIVVGTQIIAKGHNFPHLTLVGIIDADLGLAGGDLRASEKTFQLLHQVAGRAGRHEDKGLVVIQSYMPDNEVIKDIKEHKMEGFFKSELAARRITRMPPFSRLAGIIFAGKKEQEVKQKAAEFVRHAIRYGKDITVLGPAPAPIIKLRNNYRYRVLIKADLKLNLQKILQEVLREVQKSYTVKIKVDVDPYSFY